MKHNHLTRDIKEVGECPACDEYYVTHLRKEIDLAARLIHKAHASGNSGEFHFQLGMIQGLTGRLYELNTKVHKEALEWR